MLTPEQIELRKTLITATDASAIVGVNPWRKPLDVYADKLDLVPPAEDTGPSKVGQALEPVILRMIGESAKLHVQGSSETLRHGVLTWLGATPDGFAFDLRGKPEPACAVAEAKAVGIRQWSAWDDDAPPEYVHVQVQVQMTVAAQKRALVGALLGTDFRLYEVEHDPDLEAAILEACDAFRRNHIETRTPPTPDGSERAARAIAKMFPRVSAGIVEAPIAADEIARAYLAAKTEVAAAAERMVEAENALKIACGDREGLMGRGWRLTWKERDGGTDWKAVAKALGATEEMAKAHKRAAARVFLMKEATR